MIKSPPIDVQKEPFVKETKFQASEEIPTADLDNVAKPPIGVEEFEELVKIEKPSVVSPPLHIIDTAITTPDNKYTHFFRKNRYTRYDNEKDAADYNYPRSIYRNWKGVFSDTIDAAVRWTDGNVYFFKGAGYRMYSFSNGDVTEEGSIKDRWPSLPVPPKFAVEGIPMSYVDFTRDLDAVVVFGSWWSGGNFYAYFFKGKYYVMYDTINDHVFSGYPKPIEGNWPNMPPGFTYDLDAVVYLPDDYAYFFKGTEYVKYDVSQNRALDGYPKPIYGNWPNLMATFAEELPNNIPISNTSYFENTCRALPPSASDPKGRIVVLPGENGNYLSIVITRPIFTMARFVEYSSSASVEINLLSPPQANFLRPHTDNHIVKLKDGSLIAMKPTFDFTPVTNPKPWQQLSFEDIRDNNDGPQPGARYSQSFWRSVDGITWSYQGKIDPFVLEGGKYGYPMPIDCNGKPVDSLDDQCTEPGKDKWTFAGHDRPELYACPFTGYLYLTDKYFSGPYKDATVQSNKVVRNILLLCSKDKGQTWDVLKDDFEDQITPVVTTSTPNNRLSYTSGLMMVPKFIFPIFFSLLIPHRSIMVVGRLHIG